MHNFIIPLSASTPRQMARSATSPSDGGRAADLPPRPSATVLVHLHYDTMTRSFGTRVGTPLSKPGVFHILSVICAKENYRKVWRHMQILPADIILIGEKYYVEKNLRSRCD